MSIQTGPAAAPGGARSEARTRPGAVGGRATAKRSPRTVIRGESTPKGAQKGAIIDWLRFTWLPTGSISHALEDLARNFKKWFPAPISFIHVDRGMFGYETSQDILVWHNAELVKLGTVAMGGGTAGGTMMLDLTGKGCSFVKDWQAVYCTMQDLDARITRVDTALDLFEGFRLDDFNAMYFAGDFNAGGRIPSRRWYEVGDMHSPFAGGRTLYLGKKANGKELCIYEKGKQLGDPESEWIRVEIRFGNRDRVIPHDVVLDPTRFFAGAFVALENLVETLPERIPTEQKELAVEERSIVLKRINHYLKQQFGKGIYQLALEVQRDYQALFESIHVVGVPRRLEKSSVAAGVHGAHEPAPF